MNSLRTTPQSLRRQRGVVFIVMMIIMVLGTAALLVSSLNSPSLQIARDQVSTDALAQAKEALIAYAASDSNRPGELPCPDFDNDGASTPTNDYSGTNCKTLVGWLPWKTLGLPNLRDANGDHLWYAVANPFHANSTAVLNSDTPTAYPASMLTVKDGPTSTMLESNVVAIVFSPGFVISSQTRSPSDSNATTAVSNYLEGDNATPGTAFQTANDRVVPAPAPLVNDRVLAIGRDTLFQAVEKRVAREVKKCLDDYAAAPGNTNQRYPWAALVSDNSALLSRPGTYDVRFGRLPEIANTSTTSGGSPPTDPLLVAGINAVQTALVAYLNAPSAATMNALRLAGDALKDYTPTDPAHTAGTIADNCTLASCDTTLLQSRISEALGGGTPDATMPASWSTVASCNTLFNTSYWADWRDLVFYQVAGGYQPGGGVFTALHVSGSGNPVIDNNTYRAAVLVAGRILSPQSRPSTVNPPDNYLETSGTTSNSHQSAQGTSPSTDFVTYRPSDIANYLTVNDLVLCLDGEVNCK